MARAGPRSVPARATEDKAEAALTPGAKDVPAPPPGAPPGGGEWVYEGPPRGPVWKVVYPVVENDDIPAQPNDSAPAAALGATAPQPSTPLGLHAAGAAAARLPRVALRRATISFC